MGNYNALILAMQASANASIAAGIAQATNQIEQIGVGVMTNRMSTINANANMFTKEAIGEYALNTETQAEGLKQLRTVAKQLGQAAGVT